MTVAAIPSRSSYTGNGATTAFPTGFKFLENTHVVVKVTPSGGVESVKVLDVDYTVTGAGLDAGGTVTFVVRPAVGDAIVIERETPILQATNLRTQGSFSPAVHEERFDERAMVDQELDRRVDALENSATTNTAIAGDGLYVSGSTWHVGAGNGLIAAANDVSVDYGAAAELVNVTKAAENAGVSNKVARADHKHDIDTAAPVAVAIGNAQAEGGSTGLARADHVHAVAAPGTPADVDSGAPSAGVSTKFAREDHKHDISLGVPVSIGTANSSGAGATTMAASDHVHNHGNQTTATHHAVATTVANGFQSAADKLKQDNSPDTFSGTVQTTNAVATMAVEHTVTANGLEIIEVLVAGYRSTRAEGVGLHLVGTFRRDGAGLVQVGATTTLASHKDAGAAAWTAAFDVSAAPNVRVNVTGEAAKTVNWKVQGRATPAVSP